MNERVIDCTEGHKARYAVVVPHADQAIRYLHNRKALAEQQYHALVVGNYPATQIINLRSAS